MITPNVKHTFVCFPFFEPIIALKKFPEPISDSCCHQNNLVCIQNAEHKILLKNGWIMKDLIKITTCILVTTYICTTTKYKHYTKIASCICLSKNLLLKRKLLCAYTKIEIFTANTGLGSWSHYSHTAQNQLIKYPTKKIRFSWRKKWKQSKCY